MIADATPPSSIAICTIVGNDAHFVRHCSGSARLLMGGEIVAASGRAKSLTK